MKKTLATLILGLMLTIGGSIVCAGPLEDGLAAAQRGDYATALRLWRPLADRGNASAQHNLGVMYSNGHGVPQDYIEAVKWYRKAAEQGFADAQFNLGNIYLNGRGVPQDYAEAVKWYRLAADQGNADAQINLGLMYANGQGVPQNFVRAHMWFNLSVTKGNKNAAKYRDLAAGRMTPEQLAQAQEMTRKCQLSNYKQCD